MAGGGGGHGPEEQGEVRLGPLELGEGQEVAGEGRGRGLAALLPGEHVVAEAVDGLQLVDVEGGQHPEGLTGLVPPPL